MRIADDFGICGPDRYETHQRPQEGQMTTQPYIPQSNDERKLAPMARGLIDYFPAALFEVARHSFLCNEKHNPGEPMHHARGKSMDHADCVIRHVLERGGFDTLVIAGVEHRIRHSAALAWRALALLQEEMEAEGAAPARAAKFPAEVLAAVKP